MEPKFQRAGNTCLRERAGLEAAEEWGSGLTRLTRRLWRGLGLSDPQLLMYPLQQQKIMFTERHKSFKRKKCKSEN
jgi:hypothetical protein